MARSAFVNNTDWQTGSRVGGKWIVLEVMSGQGWVIHTTNTDKYFLTNLKNCM